MSRDSQILAQIMCDLTRDIVWDYAIAIARSSGHDMMGDLKTRVGSGKKTYHIVDFDHGKRKHVITYGRKMIESKKDFSKTAYWLTGKEIAKKGFYDGDASYKNLLAHTILHESAHAIQNSVGERHFNEVHNKAFYSLLNKLYQACGEAVALDLEQRATKAGITLEFDPDTYEVDSQGNKVSTHIIPQKHDAVAITIKGHRCLGVVTSPGKLKSEVLIYRGRHQNASFNASNTLLSHLDPDDIRPDPKKDIPKTIAWCPGDKVHFYSTNMKYYGGEIEKVNPKKCIVRILESDNSRDVGGRVDVPKSMLHEGDRHGNERRPANASKNDLSF